MRDPLGAFLTLTLLAALAAVPTAAQSPADAKLPPSSEPEACTHVVVHGTVVNGTVVTIRAKDVAVVHLLEEIARHSDLRVTVYGALSARITLDLKQAPMREAVERLLQGQNFALRYAEPAPPRSGAANGHATQSVTNQLWVFPEETGQATLMTGKADSESPRPTIATPTTLEAISQILDHADEPGGREGALDALAAAALSSEEVSVRAEAVHGLGELDDPNTLPVLGQALRDEEQQVRQAAIEALSDLGSADAAWELAPVLDDPSADLREEAIYALGEMDASVARILLERALADEEPVVREAAAEVLEELESLEEEEETGDEEEEDS